jgi:predicted negative regulator of RcsB-dependent stress response
MVEGNSYTLAIVIILGLVAIFLIYWFAIRNKTCDNKVQQYENLIGTGEKDDNEELSD